jgi:hypothetical protein
MLIRKFRLPAVALSALLASAGCSDDTDEPESGGQAGSKSTAGSKSDGGSKNTGGSKSNGGTESNSDAGTSSGATAGDGSAGEGPGDAKAQYLFQIGIAGDADNGGLYLMIQDEINLNVKVKDLENANALEFEPYTGVAAIDGHVIIGQSNAPIGRKFAVSETGEFEQVGDDLRFDDYFTSAVDGLNFYHQAIKGTDMFLHYGSDRAFRKHWNVREWKLLEDLETTALPTPEVGWTLYSTGNRTGMRDWKGAMFQTYNLEEDATGAVGEKTYIAVFDAESFVETDVLEIPCTGLAQQTQDEDGNVYVSTTFNAPTLSLYGKQEPSCVVRLKPDGTQDEEWGNKSLADFTGGFDGVNFRYLAKGKAVANVLHHDLIDNVNWDGDVDPAVVAKIQGEWVGEDFVQEDLSIWELELIDIEKGTSTPITGWDEDHDVGFYLTGVTVDGRVFFNYQLDTYSDKPTDVMYELDLETATVTKVGELEGTFAGLERLR